ncbi:MAG: 2-succinyl-5-enolpyruvyl-6-hydroxy-3-cyclohexene-1-carboxylic-acid synthase [Propionibacteriaceae bacterium]|jgi:2-succinyl-5-enolpyruvyl-6-hydroxy-3-cyclohexene-1-carboxylate synthase|nr:2-succinyl-5-enolpyruvyl-6-hydroxy-3-cyclohexene-1-carboxylic-acid synthase [Propionibacteriaceae bacterium]
MSDSPACAAAVIAQLAENVSDIVLCPGSRSAPLALAALAFPGRVHVRVDERSAAFLALGMAKGDPRRPVAVITTSGTAVGNLLPAVMEAAHSDLPLILLTADRPGELVGFGANQTTEQTGVFAGFVRWQAELDSRGDARAWMAQTARAVGHALGGLGNPAGPVHLNIHLGLPLTGQRPFQLPEARPLLFAQAGQSVLELAAEPGTVVLCGDADPAVGAQAVVLAEEAGLPLIAEPSSNARRGPNALALGRVLLDSRLADEVRRVIVYGHPTLSRPVNRLLSRPDVTVVVAGGSRVDPGQSASAFADRVVIPGGDDPAWLAAWQRADRRAGEAWRKVLSENGKLTGYQLAETVLASLAADEILVLGNSNPVRDADLAPIRDAAANWQRTGGGAVQENRDFDSVSVPDSSVPSVGVEEVYPNRGLGPVGVSDSSVPSVELGAVYANRGLGGIDGTLSTAVGIALRARSQTTLLCGDLSFLHDSNALAIGADEPRPDLRVVVADDHGGSIFATLEYGQPQYAAVFERVFATSVPTDLVALAQSHGLPARRVHNLTEVQRCLAEPCHGIEVLVVEIDRSTRTHLSAKLVAIAKTL